MKLFKPAATLAAIALLVLVASCASTGDKQEKPLESIPNYLASGKIVNLKDKVIEVALFLDLEPNLTFFYEGYRHSMPLFDIKRLEDIGNGYLNLTTVKDRSFKIVGTMGSISQKSMIYFHTKSLLEEAPVADAQGKIPEKKIIYLTSRIDGEATKLIEFVWKKSTNKQTDEQTKEYY